MNKKEEKKVLDDLGCPWSWSNFMNKLTKHKGLKNHVVFQVYMPVKNMHAFADELELSKEDCYITLCDYFRYRVTAKSIRKRQVIDIIVEEEQIK